MCFSPRKVVCFFSEDFYRIGFRLEGQIWKGENLLCQEKKDRVLVQGVAAEAVVVRMKASYYYEARTVSFRRVQKVTSNVKEVTTKLEIYAH